MNRIRCIAAAVVAGAAMSTAQVVLAQQPWPTRPVRVLLGFAPGGFTDAIIRQLAPKISEGLGQQLVLENRPGASGTIALDLAMKAPADGYTLTFCSNAEMTVNPHVLAKVNYDPIRDFQPIVAAAIGPLVFSAHPEAKVATLAQWVAAAKAKPDAVPYASAGNGTVNHLAGEWFSSLAGVRMVHVPYKGGGPATQDVLAGQVPIGVLAAAAAMPHIKSGRIKALAVTTAKRVSFAADLPTVAELGYPGFEVALWAAFYGQPGIPKEVVTRLNAEMNKVLQTADARERLATLGVDPLGGAPEAVTKLLQVDLERFGKIARENNIKAN